MKKYLKKNVGSLILAIVFAIAYAGAFVGISLLLQEIIDIALAGEIRKATIISACYIAAFSFVCFMQALSQVRLNQKIAGEIRSTIVGKILKKDTLSFEKYKGSDYISLVQNDVKKIEDGYIETILSIVSAIAMLVMAVIVITRYSWVFTAFMFGMTLVMFVVPTIFTKKLSAATLEFSKAQENMTEGLTEVVSGYEVVKSFQKEDYATAKFEKCNSLLMKRAKTFGLVKQINSSTSSTLMFSMQMVICLLAGYFIYAGKISYGSTVGVIQASGCFCQPLFQLFALIPAIRALTPIWEKIEEYTAVENDEIEVSIPKKDWNRISFEDISFAYPGEEKTVLSDISLSIDKGKKYLIVGESGAGKTTLINMICGNYAPLGGRILFDGKAVESAMETLKRNTAVVWQNVFLFNESIKNNILMGATDEKKLGDVIKEARIAEMVMDKGIDYEVGSDGNLLSGGQKQRIAIARALFADRDIIVLDEGISALDKETALEIEDTLLKRKGQTLISISHHVLPEMRAKYDEIIELKDGTIRIA
ncbi:ABC transporter ATP-binding protein [Butyrivibrio fibrisolvens]|nr:ABC transporter ATP-binding protein [Butyrivibrio fibrisolvens]